MPDRKLGVVGAIVREAQVSGMTCLPDRLRTSRNADSRSLR